MSSTGTRTSTFRLTPEDLQILDRAGEILGAESRSATIRLMARTVVEAATAKASPKKKAAKRPTARAGARK